MCGLIGALLAAIGCVLIREAVRQYAYEDLRTVFLIVWVLFIVMAVPVIMIAVSGLKEGMKLRREQSLGSNGAIVLGFTIFLVIAWLIALAGPYCVRYMLKFRLNAELWLSMFGRPACVAFSDKFLCGFQTCVYEKKWEVIINERD